MKNFSYLSRSFLARTFYPPSKLKSLSVKQSKKLKEALLLESEKVFTLSSFDRVLIFHIFFSFFSFIFKEWVGNFVEDLSEASFKLSDNQSPIGNEPKLLDCQQTGIDDRRHRSVCFPWTLAQHFRYRHRRSTYGENLLHVGQRLRRFAATTWRMDLWLVYIFKRNTCGKNRVLFSNLRFKRWPIYNSRWNVFTIEVI